MQADRQKINALLDDILQERAEQKIEKFKGVIAPFLHYGKVESPIEEILIHALLSGEWDYWDNPESTQRHNGAVFTAVPNEYSGPCFATDRENGQYCIDQRAVMIVPQYKIERFRTDFAIFTGDPDTKRYEKIAIECDGHDFHEKHKKQVQRDKERDRFFQSKGWKLLRFSGSEIYNNPIGKADEIIEFVKDVYFHDVTEQPRVL